MNILEFSLKKEKIKLFLAYFALLDILVLPYLQLFIMPISLPFILFYFVLDDFKIKNDLDFKLISGLCLCAIISTVFSFLNLNLQAFYIDNIKYVLQLITTFLFFYFFKNLEYINKRKILYIVNFFFFFIFILVAYFMYKPLDSIEFIKTFYGRTTVLEEDFLMDLRFSYLFSDPNSAAYFTLMTFGYFLHNYETKFNFFLVFLIVLIVILLTQSSGALAAFAIMLLAFTYKTFKDSFKIKYLIVVFSILLSLVIITTKLIENKNEIMLVESVYDRTFNSSDRIDSGGGRFHHWNALFSMYPLPFGRGYTLFDEGFIKKPHSDILGLIYRYGFLSLLFFLVFLFRHFRENIYIFIPALICIGINAMLEDQKLFGLFLILIVINHKMISQKNA